MLGVWLLRNWRLVSEGRLLCLWSCVYLASGEKSEILCGVVCALRARRLFFSLFLPPAQRAAEGGLLGAAAPPRPPLHSPRTTPLDFRISPLLRVSLQGLSIFRHCARAARPLLRELPSPWSGDLPARRAMPSAGAALSTSFGVSGWLGVWLLRKFGMYCEGSAF